MLHPACACAGDGDPVDVCDIGTATPAASGTAYTVKVIGALAMLDGGETDWKLLAVRTDDPLASQVSCITDASTPASVRQAADDIREWFRTYKTYEGKGLNEFAFGGRWLGRDDALKIIASTHEQWRRLVAAGPKPPGAKGPWVPPAGWQQAATGTHAGKDADLALATTTKAPGTPLA